MSKLLLAAWHQRTPDGLAYSTPAALLRGRVREVYSQQKTPTKNDHTAEKNDGQNVVGWFSSNCQQNLNGILDCEMRVSFYCIPGHERKHVHRTRSMNGMVSAQSKNISFGEVRNTRKMEKQNELRKSFKRSFGVTIGYLKASPLTLRLAIADA